MKSHGIGGVCSMKFINVCNRLDDLGSNPGQHRDSALAKAEIHLFFIQLWVNIGTDWVLWLWYSNWFTWKQTKKHTNKNQYKTSEFKSPVLQLKIDWHVKERLGKSYEMKSVNKIVLSFLWLTVKVTGIVLLQCPGSGDKTHFLKLWEVWSHPYVGITSRSTLTPGK